MKNIIFTALLLVFGVTLNAQKNVNPVRSRTDQSDLVVEGKVIECRSYWNKDHTQILTSNVVEVSKILKGKDFNKSVIEVVTLGGMVDDRFSFVTHQTTFKVGMEGIFFCRDNKKLSSDLIEPVGTSFVLTYPESGFIHYFHEKLNPAAAERARTYSNIEKEIYREATQSALSS